METSTYPAINAALNATSAVLLLAGRIFIARKQVIAHRNCMVGAFATSAVFLADYLYYHFVVMNGAVTRFQHQGPVRTIYFALLLSHTFLAVAVVPMVLITLNHAWRERFDRHRRIARWTYPVWQYVSATGVLIYFFLYHWFPARG